MDHSGVWERIQARLRTPIEMVATSVIILTTCLLSVFRNGSRVPFKVGGHEYVWPPREIYILAAVAAAITLLSVIGDAVGRFRALLRRRREHSTALLEPAVGTNAHVGRVALYTRRWTPVSDVFIYLVSAAFGTWYVGRQIW